MRGFVGPVVLRKHGSAFKTSEIRRRRLADRSVEACHGSCNRFSAVRHEAGRHRSGMHRLGIVIEGLRQHGFDQRWQAHQ